MMCNSYKTITGFTLVMMAWFLVQMLSAGNALTFGILYSEMRHEFNSSQSDARWIALIFNGLLGFVGNTLDICFFLFIYL
jgi:hypothetical protein